MPVNAALATEEIVAKKAAKAAYDREYRAKNAEKIKARKAAEGKTEKAKARVQRWVEENRDRSREIKRAWKKRNPSADRLYYEANSERIRERERNRAAANPEANRLRAREWYKANPDRAKEAYRNNYRKKRHEYIARARARYTKLVLATPAWANHEKIATIYREAAEKGMHVDHIVPLQGQKVCGLHTHDNLQLLTPKENLKKGNRYAD